MLLEINVPAGSPASKVPPVFIPTGLECVNIRPTGICGLTISEDSCVAAFVYHNKTLCTVRDASVPRLRCYRRSCGWCKRSVFERVSVHQRINFQRGCPAGKSYRFGSAGSHGSNQGRTRSTHKLDDIAAFQITRSALARWRKLPRLLRSAAGRSPGHAEVESPVAAPSFDIWN